MDPEPELAIMNFQVAGNMEARAGLPICSWRDLIDWGRCIVPACILHLCRISGGRRGGPTPTIEPPLGHLPLTWTILLSPGLQFSATPTPTPRPEHIDDDGHDDHDSIGQRCHSAWTTNCPHLQDQPFIRPPQAPAVYYRRIHITDDEPPLHSFLTGRSAGGASKLAFEKPLRRILIILPATGLAQPARPRDSSFPQCHPHLPAPCHGNALSLLRDQSSESRQSTSISDHGRVAARPHGQDKSRQDKTS